MSPQKIPQRKGLVAKSAKKTMVATEKAKVKPQNTPTRSNAKEKVRPKSKESKAETQQALRVGKAAVKRERQPRTKADKVLTEYRTELAATQFAERVSFIVRLTVDSYGQPRRTEVEHVLTGKKQNFRDLNGENLIAFMKGCISPTTALVHTVSAASPSDKVAAKPLKSLGPKSRLLVRDVQVLRPEELGLMTLTLMSEETFIVQIRFQIKGLETHSLIFHGAFYEIRIFANELTSGKSRLLTIYQADLFQDILEYTALAQVAGLSPGLYRLFTVVALGPPIMIGGFHGKIVIQVL